MFIKLGCKNTDFPLFHLISMVKGPLLAKLAKNLAFSG